MEGFIRALKTYRENRNENEYVLKFHSCSQQGNVSKQDMLDFNCGMNDLYRPPVGLLDIMFLFKFNI